jgi:hypothetical protein
MATAPHASGFTTLTSLDNTLGAMLIGTLFSMMYVSFLSSFVVQQLEYRAFSLWGVICTQAYDYFMDRDNTDGRLQRSIVRSLLHRILLLLSFAAGRFALVGSVFRFCTSDILLMLIGNRVIDTFDSAMHAHMAYHFLVKSFTDPSNLLKAPWYVRMKRNTS